MKICAVQLVLKNCKTRTEFIEYIYSQLKIQEQYDILVFPENINLCLLNVQDDYKIFSLKDKLEIFVDKILSKLNLSFILKKQKLDLQKSIILDCFSKLAREYDVNIITGSFYEKQEDGIYNSIYAIDRNGCCVAKASKKDLVGLEKAFKIKSSDKPVVANFDFGKVGMCICFDLNDPDYCSKFDCDILVAPSNGYRPFPGYPFDFEKETPQIQRAKENSYAIVRPYCAGWLGPLYFSGRTMIVDKNGNILAQSTTRNKTELVFASIVS